MLKDLTPAKKELEQLMSDISERCWNAGWMHELEFALWRAVLEGPQELVGK